MKAMEGNDIFSTIVMNMCLVSDLVIIDKFKTPDFEKYKGNNYARSHLIMYYQKMVAHTRNDRLLIHYSQHSWSGASLKWYMGLEKSRIHNS